MCKCLQIMYHYVKYYELWCIFKKFASLMLARAYSVKIGVIFGVRFERRKVDQKSKPTWKLKHANSILESSEYFCKISSKSIPISLILSYTVTKLVHFLRHSLVTCDWCQIASRAAAVVEILGPKRIGVTTLTFQGHVKHRSPDRSIPHRPFRQFFGKTRRLATMHTLQTTIGRRTQHCSISATDITVG